MPRALCPVLFALAATLGAAETVVNDVRIGIGMGPMPNEQDGTRTSPAASNGDTYVTAYEDTPGLSVSIGGVYGRLDPVGFLIGLEVRSLTGEMALESTQYNNNPVQSADQLAATNGDKVPGMGFSQTGIALSLGVGLALTSSVHLELLGLAGGDWTTLDSLAGTGDLTVMEGNGLGYTVGGRFGAYWTDPETSWQFGVEAEYVRTATDFEASYLDATIESDLINSGMAFRAVFGHRF